MKKPVLSFLFIAASIMCFAQVNIGIFAGPQTTSAKYEIEGVKQPTQYKQGFQAGMSLKVPFDNRLFFTPAAFYSLKGYKVKFNKYSYPPDTAALDNNTTIHTLELALLLELDLGTQPSHLFLRGGLSIDGQLSGKEKFNLKQGGFVNRKMVFSFGDYGYVGANALLQLGFETKSGFMIFGQYTQGMGNISNNDGGPEIRHRAFGISIGQYFKRKKTVIDTRNKE